MKTLNVTFLFLFLHLIGGCKSATVNETEALSSQAEAVFCNNDIGFRGLCRVVELTGRQDTTTEEARNSGLSRITHLGFRVPGKSQNGLATVTFLAEKAEIADWTIYEGLDLYSRTGCIAQVSGGIFGESYHPRLTVRVLLNVKDNNRTGFAELASYLENGKIDATLRLQCDWQR